jgi:hypothetical protein
MTISITFNCDIPSCRECETVRMSPKKTWQQTIQQLVDKGWFLKFEQGKVNQAICPYCPDPQ